MLRPTASGVTPRDRFSRRSHHRPGAGRRQAAGRGAGRSADVEDMGHGSQGCVRHLAQPGRGAGLRIRGGGPAGSGPEGSGVVGHHRAAVGQVKDRSAGGLLHRGLHGPSEPAVGGRGWLCAGAGRVEGSGAGGVRLHSRLLRGVSDPQSARRGRAGGGSPAQGEYRSRGASEQLPHRQRPHAPGGHLR